MARNRGTHECRIVVIGELGERFATQFEGMTLVRGDGVSSLVGPVVDQAEVYGLLDQVQNLGLELVSVDVDDASTTPVPGEFSSPVSPERRM